jgi:hypothetical protein
MGTLHTVSGFKTVPEKSLQKLGLLHHGGYVEPYNSLMNLLTAYTELLIPNRREVVNLLLTIGSMEERTSTLTLPSTSSIARSVGRYNLLFHTLLTRSYRCSQDSTYRPAHYYYYSSSSSADCPGTTCTCSPQSIPYRHPS